MSQTDKINDPTVYNALTNDLHRKGLYVIDHRIKQLFIFNGVFRKGANEVSVKYL